MESPDRNTRPTGAPAGAGPFSDPLPPTDLAETRRLVGARWNALCASRIFFAGGTGFVGRWMVESLLAADGADRFGGEVHLLTRSVDQLRERAPHLLEDERVRCHEGEVTTFGGISGTFDLVIHGANPVSAALLRDDPLQMFDALSTGTRRMLDFARAADARRFLFLSSGGIYGKQPATLERMSEDYAGSVDVLQPTSAHAEGKRAAEMQCTIMHRQCGLPVTIARLFAFTGPLLPLDTHFAAGNFVRDVLRGDALVIEGDGRTIRSYLYASDMAAWLWTLALEQPKHLCYNVGSSSVVTIRDLAESCREIALTELGRDVPVIIKGKASDYGAASIYVPDVRRFTEEFGMSPTVDLREGLTRMVRWARG